MTATDADARPLTWPTLADCVLTVTRVANGRDDKPRYCWLVTDRTGTIRDSSRTVFRHRHGATHDAKKTWPEVS